VYSIRCTSIGGGTILVTTVVQRPDSGRLSLEDPPRPGGGTASRPAPSTGEELVA
jgi:hypothetical protein